MFFTQEDYKKIQIWLNQNAIKDSEFKEASLPLNEYDIISFVQNGNNVKVRLKDFLEQLFLLREFSDFINVTDKYKAKYILLKQAIQLVPYKTRKIGQVITFLNEEKEWKIYQFKGESVNQWNEESLWEDIVKAIQGSDLAADEEDLTEVVDEVSGKSLLKLKDKAYDPDNFSGLGRVILRKNIVTILNPDTQEGQDINLLTQQMINKPNTIYEIQYDFDLNNQEITIPEGCVLDFKGGSLSNGSLNGIEYDINTDNDYIFRNILFIRMPDILINASWFLPNNSLDYTQYIQDMFDCGITNIFFNKQKVYNINNTIYLRKVNFEISGNFTSTIQSNNPITLLNYTNIDKWGNYIKIKGLNLKSGSSISTDYSLLKNTPILKIINNGSGIIASVEIDLNIKGLYNSFNTNLSIPTMTGIELHSIKGPLTHIRINGNINCFRGIYTHQENSTAWMTEIIFSAKTNCVLGGKFEAGSPLQLYNIHQPFTFLQFEDAIKTAYFDCTNIEVMNHSFIWDLGNYSAYDNNKYFNTDIGIKAKKINGYVRSKDYPIEKHDNQLIDKIPYDVRLLYSSVNDIKNFNFTLSDNEFFNREQSLYYYDNIKEIAYYSENIVNLNNETSERWYWGSTENKMAAVMTLKKPFIKSYLHQNINKGYIKYQFDLSYNEIFSASIVLKLPKVSSYCIYKVDTYNEDNILVYEGEKIKVDIIQYDIFSNNGEKHLPLSNYVHTTNSSKYIYKITLIIYLNDKIRFLPQFNIESSIGEFNRSNQVTKYNTINASEIFCSKNSNDLISDRKHYILGEFSKIYTKNHIIHIVVVKNLDLEIGIVYKLDKSNIYHNSYININGKDNSVIQNNGVSAYKLEKYINNIDVNFDIYKITVTSDIFHINYIDAKYAAFYETYNLNGWINTLLDIKIVVDSGNYTQANLNLNDIMIFKDTINNKLLLYNKSKWYNSDGNPIDSLKQGTTQQRPTDVKAGFYYFDTTLNKPIWKKDDTTNVWIDAMGAEV